MVHPIFEGSAAALATPMNKAGEVDYEAMGRMIEFQLESKTDALLVNGTTGESAALEDEEKLKVIEFAVRRVDGRIPVIAGAGSNSTSHAIKLSKEAQSLGADALLHVTPYYNKTSQEGLIRHFAAIGDSVNLPILLYNVPGRTGVTIQPETYLELSKHPNIRGTKEAGGNISLTARTAALCGRDFHIYSGNDDQTLPIMALGGKGVVSVLANIMPARMHKLCRAILQGGIEEGRQIQLELLDIMEALFCDVNPIPVKAALSLMGLCGENYRLPLVPMKAEKREDLIRVMQIHGLLKV